MHSRNLVVIEGVGGGGGGGGGVGGAFVVSGVDKYRRTGLDKLQLFGTLRFFLKLFKILLDCVTPARYFWCYVIMSRNNPFPIVSDLGPPAFHTAMRVNQFGN